MSDLIAFVVTQSFVVLAVVAGFVIGGVSLWTVHRQVAEIGRKLDRQEYRLRMVEGSVRRIEERWNGGDK